MFAYDVGSKAVIYVKKKIHHQMLVNRKWRIAIRARHKILQNPTEIVYGVYCTVYSIIYGNMDGAFF